MKILESQTTVQRRNQEVSEHRGGLWKEFWKGVMVWRQFIAATLTRIFTMVLKTVFTRFSTIANGTRPHGVLSPQDRKSTRLNSSHVKISYAVFCLKKKNR